jgi:hypothetical protein
MEGNPDLARENAVLRLEIQTLFRRLVSEADTASKQSSVSNESINCQTDTQTDPELAFAIPIVERALSGVARELSYQTALHEEHTRRSLEVETKIGALGTTTIVVVIISYYYCCYPIRLSFIFAYCSNARPILPLRLRYEVS